MRSSGPLSALCLGLLLVACADPQAAGAPTSGTSSAPVSPSASSPSASSPSASSPSASSPASGTAPSPAPTASSKASPAAEPGRVLEITVRGRQVTPAPDRVAIRVGERLRLRVTSDHDDVLHAHGFDVEERLTAGQPTTVELVGAEPGQYEVETHRPALRLLVVQVR